jgi:ribosomal protein L37AE/L43A
VAADGYPRCRECDRLRSARRYAKLAKPRETYAERKLRDSLLCPTCDKPNMKKRRFVELWTCQSCRSSSTLAEMQSYLETRNKQKVKAKAEGSGQFAGPITIGRGFNWKAGFM